VTTLRSDYAIVTYSMLCVGFLLLVDGLITAKKLGRLKVNLYFRAQ